MRRQTPLLGFSIGALVLLGAGLVSDVSAHFELYLPEREQPEQC